MMKSPRWSALVAVVPLLALAACGGDNVFENPGDDAIPTREDSDTIVIGTANFPESEIIGQLWAAALRTQGLKTKVRSGIGSREVYLQAIQEGTIDLVPEYSGNLAQFFGDDSTLTVGMSSEEVLKATSAVIPKNLALGEASEAESKDSYRVTSDTAHRYGLRSLADLKNMDHIRLAANPEITKRYFGPKGLEEYYGVPPTSIEFKPISDGGGPLTVAAILGGTVDVANIYTTSPALDAQGNEADLVTLDDPKDMIPHQNVVPLMAKGRLSREARETIARVNRALTTGKLKDMNLRNIGKDKEDPEKIARDFVEDVF